MEIKIKLIYQDARLAKFAKEVRTDDAPLWCDDGEGEER